jgi:hypothetical protein
MAALALATVGCAAATQVNFAPEPAADSEKSPAPSRSARDSIGRFYQARPYGSEAEFSPLTEVLNEGFDMFRLNNFDRRLGAFPYERAATNVWHQMIHPDSALRAYGVAWTVKDELLPLSMGKSGGPQWLANYSCHFLGSGMVSARMVEWYAAHDVAHPVAMSVLSMYAAHFTNEMVEDGGSASRVHAMDAVADLYVFDVAGILAFRSDRVQRLFSNDHLQLTNWQGQAAVMTSDYRLENTDQEFILRAGLPKTDRWRAMVGWGIYSMAGLSYGPRDGTAISVAAGTDIKTGTLDSLSGKRNMSFAPYGGVFIDRQGSLLASIVAKNSPEVVLTGNLYPGVLRVGGTSFGLWGQLLRDHQWRFGIVPNWGLGVGHASLPH